MHRRASAHHLFSRYSAWLVICVSSCAFGTKFVT